jgi:hypothetical protein
MGHWRHQKSVLVHACMLFTKIIFYNVTNIHIGSLFVQSVPVPRLAEKDHRLPGRRLRFPGGGHRHR